MDAEDLLEAGDFGAAADLLRMRAAGPDIDAGVFEALGWALENVDGQAASARDAYAQALELDPSSLVARMGLANVSWTLGDHDAARDGWRAVHEAVRATHQPDAEALELSGWCAYRLARFDDAIAALEASLAQEPERLSARFDLALVHMAAGRTDLATAAYVDALDRADALPAERRGGTLHVALADLTELIRDPNLPAVAADVADLVARFANTMD